MSETETPDEQNDGETHADPDETTATEGGDDDGSEGETLVDPADPASEDNEAGEG